MINNLYLPFSNKIDLSLALNFQSIISEMPETLELQNSQITGVYGSFNGAIWNGGRIIPKSKTDLYEIESTIKLLNSRNIKCRMTFTNSLLTKEHLKDSYCNSILEILDNNFGNEIIIASSILEEYLIQTYPNLPLVSSITKGNDFETFFTAMNQDQYSLVVAFPKKKILNYISQLSEEKQNKIELLINSGCGHCPLAKEHYENISRFNLSFPYNQNFRCYKESISYEQQQNNIDEEEQLVHNFQLWQYLNIHHYKIQGRGTDINNLINEYLNCIFSKEYHNLIKQKVQRGLFLI